MRKGDERVRDYAGLLTAVVAFVIYTVAMLSFTRKDMLEIIVSYMVPYFIGGEEDDAE